MLPLTAAQAALAKHIEPGNRSAEETLDRIMAIIDHEEVVQATVHKLHQMLRKPAQSLGFNNGAKAERGKAEENYREEKAQGPGQARPLRYQA